MNRATGSRVTHRRLREVLHYDPDLGWFMWLVAPPYSQIQPGDIAGRMDSRGYVALYVDGVRYKAHRLAWLWMNGVWPEGQIDHRFEIKDDNRISELRDVCNAVNVRNVSKARTNNKLGLLGVSPSRDRFKASIRVDGKRISLGTYDEPEAASRAYNEAKRRHHPESLSFLAETV